MTESELKLQARLIAIEYVLGNAVANIYALAGLSKANIEQMHKDAKTLLSKETLPGADPAQADMWLSEIEEAVTKIQSASLEMWEDKARKAGLRD